MKITFKSVAALAIVLGSIAAQAESLDQLKELCRNQKWDQVIPLLRAYRNQPGGRSPLVDYMLGFSECHVPGKENKGETVLKYVQETYHLSDQARDATTKAIEFCQHHGTTAQQDPAFLYVPVSGQLSNGPMVAGKGGYTVGRSSKVTTVNAAVTPVPIADLQKRIFSPTEANQALRAAEARLPQARGVVRDRFVIVCSGFCDVPVEAVADCLESYRHALHFEFNMEIPDSLVTVYLAGRPDDVTTYANRLHGISLPLGTVAYSVYDDLSMAGMAAYTGSEMACGSLAHELVHLSIRQNFGDSPAWLEEGLASEVAVSDPRENLMEFQRSWRDDTLQDYWHLRPTVGGLLAANWSAYATNHLDSVSRVAALHAMAAVFIRYLDSKQKLLPVYFAMRDRRFPAGAESPRSGVSILEEQMKMNVAEIDADFVKWFTRSSHHQVGDHPASGSAPPHCGVSIAANDPPCQNDERKTPSPVVKK